MAGSTMLQEFKNEPLDAPWPVPSRQPLSSPSTGPRSTAPVLAAVAPTVGFRLDSEQTAALHRHIPALAETVREIVRQGQPAQLVIDLSELAPAPSTKNWRVCVLSCAAFWVRALRSSWPARTPRWRGRCSRDTYPRVSPS